MRLSGWCALPVIYGPPECTSAITGSVGCLLLCDDGDLGVAGVEKADGRGQAEATRAYHDGGALDGVREREESKKGMEARNEVQGDVSHSGLRTARETTVTLGGVVGYGVWAKGWSRRAFPPVLHCECCSSRPRHTPATPPHCHLSVRSIPIIH